MELPRDGDGTATRVDADRRGGSFEGHIHALQFPTDEVMGPSFHQRRGYPKAKTAGYIGISVDEAGQDPRPVTKDARNSFAGLRLTTPVRPATMN